MELMNTKMLFRIMEGIFIQSCMKIFKNIQKNYRKIDRNEEKNFIKNVLFDLN